MEMYFTSSRIRLQPSGEDSERGHPHGLGHENLTPDRKFIRPQNAFEGRSQLLSALCYFWIAVMFFV
jgi:hypothetical protein